MVTMPMNGGTMNGGAAGTWPENVGIINMEIYFPNQYVDQTELEAFDGVSAGKYTIGLGQTRMGVCSDVEDINSLCLTVLDRLVKNTPGLGYADIGRLEVGTETLIDKSKSVKSCLMKLFEESGNSDVEGVDSTNACYGGTAALFNCVSWIESSYWDKRYAVAVCADIAVYASGAARPTGGAGAVAMLIGPNAPLVLDRGLRSTHVQHVYDFYKPDLSSEYPVVDGQLSVQCYLAALDKCYQNFCRKGRDVISDHVSMADFDALLFHTPFCKLVQKSVGRLALNDFVRLAKEDRLSAAADLQAFVDVQLENTYFDKAVEKAFMTHSKAVFEAKTKPSLHMATNVGNMYTASLYGGLVSHLCSKPADQLTGSRIGLFSYGSGLVSSFYSLTVRSQGLDQLLSNLSSVPKRLESRAKMAPESFDKMMKLREETHHKVPYQPVGDVESLFPGTWYLSSVDDKARRSYAKHEEKASNGHA